MPCPICPDCDGPYPGPPRSGISVQTEEQMRADHHIYVNADRSRVVEEHDPDAAFLLAAAGDDVSAEDVKRYGLNASKAKAADEESDESPKAGAEAESKAMQSPPANKAQAPASKKADEK